MFDHKWKQTVFTVPNLLSFFRLTLIPVYMHLYFRAKTPGDYHLAGLILAVSCLTDAIDGKIARKFHMVSTLGKILDPLADKITQFTLILCLALRYPVLNPVLALFSVKELMQVLLGIIYLRRGKMLPGALMAGKVHHSAVCQPDPSGVLPRRSGLFPQIHRNDRYDLSHGLSDQLLFCLFRQRMQGRRFECRIKKCSGSF